MALGFIGDLLGMNDADKVKDPDPILPSESDYILQNRAELDMKQYQETFFPMEMDALAEANNPLTLEAETQFAANRGNADVQQAAAPGLGAARLGASSSGRTLPLSNMIQTANNQSSNARVGAEVIGDERDITRRFNVASTGRSKRGMAVEGLAADSDDVQFKNIAKAERDATWQRQRIANEQQLRNAWLGMVGSWAGGAAGAGGGAGSSVALSQAAGSQGGGRQRGGARARGYADNGSQGGGRNRYHR